MEHRETIIKEYFNSWISSNDSILCKVFDSNIKYIECYGPAYEGLAQIHQWFKDWHSHGARVIKWNIVEFVHYKENCICDWYFECEYDGKIDGFNGVSWVKFNDNNKIVELREYKSEVPNYFPYRTK